LDLKQTEQEPGFAEGEIITVTARPVQEHPPPGEGIRRSVGSWADDPQGLDRWLEEMQRGRQLDRQGLMWYCPPNAALRGLQGFDAVDVNQGNVDKAVCFGIDNRKAVLADGDNFRMPDRESLAVGKP
jgi:hypothetical protein